MASPIRPGTSSSTAFASKNIDIISEHITIRPDKAFQFADFFVRYSIRSDLSGLQVPLLFYAKDLEGAFGVWVDGVAQQIEEVPREYYTIEGTPLAGFSKYTQQSKKEDTEDPVMIAWSKQSEMSCQLHDLKFFRADLSEGTHQIQVRYRARVWQDKSDWVKRYSFRYSLAPARHWSSFGGLDVSLDGTGFRKVSGTNLGTVHSGHLDSFANWHFTQLPSDDLEVFFQPKPSGFAQFLIELSPFGMALLVGFFLVLVHVWWVGRFRRQHPQRRYSMPVILGSILLPFLILLCYVLSYPFIDGLIGIHASRYHGYYILVFFFYPFLVLGYGLLIWLFDYFFRRYLRAQIANSL
ncbi:MAG: hypothetical protein JST36_06975 [Bacteroidetes bacterium]|nr:hypothetical protein [Bacteroidota bacterium]